MNFLDFLGIYLFQQNNEISNLKLSIVRNDVLGFPILKVRKRQEKNIKLMS